MVYLRLIYEFFKIGLFAVGGGMATLPFLMDLTKKYDWYTAKEMTDMVAISQSTPGPVGINMATYAGFNAAGLPGGIIATLALTAPALIIMLIIAKFMTNFSKNKTVQSAFNGIRPTVAALIAYAVWQLMKVSFAVIENNTVTGIDYIGITICLCLFAVMQVKQLKNLHPLAWITLGAVIGIVLRL